MDQNQIGFGLFWGFGNPAVHDGAVAEIGGGGFKTNSGETGTVPSFHDRSVTETLAAHRYVKFEYSNNPIEELEKVELLIFPPLFVGNGM